MAITRIHVNQHVIRANGKTGDRNPVFTVKSRGKNNYAQTVEIYDEEGVVCARLVYSPSFTTSPGGLRPPTVRQCVLPLMRPKGRNGNLT